jgi:CheY-like chemotaxis protein
MSRLGVLYNTGNVGQKALADAIVASWERLGAGYAAEPVGIDAGMTYTQIKQRHLLNGGGIPFDRLSIPVELEFHDQSAIRRAGGLALLGHIRLGYSYLDRLPATSGTAEALAQDAAAELALMPVILYSVCSATSILRRHPSCALLASPGALNLQLPTNRRRLAEASLMERLPNGAADRLLKPYWRINESEREDIKHTYLNRAGPGFMADDVRALNAKLPANHPQKVPDTSSDQREAEADPSPLERSSLLVDNTVALKKLAYQRGRPGGVRDAGDLPALRELAAGKAILYIDDDHANGWSEALSLLLAGPQVAVTVVDADESTEVDGERRTSPDLPPQKNSCVLHCCKSREQAESILDACYTKLTELADEWSKERIAPGQLGDIYPETRVREAFPYDLILVDLKLDNTEGAQSSGLEVLKWFRTRFLNYLSWPPVIVFTASEQKLNYEHSVVESMASGYFVKGSALSTLINLCIQRLAAYDGFRILYVKLLALGCCSYYPRWVATAPLNDDGDWWMLERITGSKYDGVVQLVEELLDGFVQYQLERESRRKYSLANNLYLRMRQLREQSRSNELENTDFETARNRYFADVEDQYLFRKAADQIHQRKGKVAGAADYGSSQISDLISDLHYCIDHLLIVHD